MNWSGQDKPPERDVLAAHVSALPGDSGGNPIAEVIADLTATIMSLGRQRLESAKPPLPKVSSEGLPALTATALGAVEGTLNSQGLDGALKEAQIMAMYAEARARNADAAKSEIEAARARLALAVDACRAFGVDPALALTPGAVPAVLLGPGLSAEESPSEALPPHVSAGLDPRSDDPSRL